MWKHKAVRIKIVDAKITDVNGQLYDTEHLVFQVHYPQISNTENEFALKVTLKMYLKQLHQ